MNENNPVITTENLHKRYGRTAALQGISCQFPRGKITGLIGPNGSGKSTLLKLIMGLIKADRGSLNIMGHPPGRKNKANIAFLPEINNLYRSMSLQELIDLYHSQFSTFCPETARELLSFMNLQPEKTVKQLSKGMVGRFKLILTMARRVPLILLDEPLTGIDIKSRSNILEGLISKFNPEEQTIILSTHEIMETERYFDHVIFLEDGAVSLQGDADDLRAEYGQSIQELAKEVFV